MGQNYTIPLFLNLIILTAIANQLLSCSTQTDVTGLWRIEESQKIKWPAFQSGFQGLIELGLKQYGKDVTGVVRFYTEAYAKVYLFQDCPCTYVRDGDLSGARLTFRFQDCNGQIFVADFQVDEDRMSGFITLPDSNSEQIELTLIRVGDEDLLREERINQGCLDFTSQ